MGHTLVAVLPCEEEQKLKNLLCGCNKIPYGRNCDREEANEILPYHITLFHWGKAEDKLYLDRLRLRQQPAFSNVSESCGVIVTGSSVMIAEEGSYLLYFAVSPQPGFREIIDHIGHVLRMDPPGFLHMTLAVSKDADFIYEKKKKLDEVFSYPFYYKIDRCRLYHIWKPVYEV